MIFCLLALSTSKEVYRFRVGLKPLDAWAQGGIEALEFLKVNPPHYDFFDFDVKYKKHEIPSHAAFLIGTDLFEYGPDGYKRRKDVGRDSSFDWEKLGNKVNGKTYVTPDELENKIKKSRDWNGNYNILYHNCHHFVKWCLENVGAGYFYKNYNHRYLT